MGLGENQYRLRKPSVFRGTDRPTAVDLFSGAGGLTLGLINAGFKVVCCGDSDDACRSTHGRNFPGVPFIPTDITRVSGADILRESKLRMGELDLLVGGPPCQGFSIIGQRQVWDPRNGLFREFLRIASELSPKCVVIENVPGLATLDKGVVLEAIGEKFAEAGYNVDCAELLAAQYGVPQMRWRVFFIGWRFDQSKRGGFPTPTHGIAGIGDLVPNRTIRPEHTKGFVTIRDAIGDLPPINAGEVGEQYVRAPEGEYQLAMREGARGRVFNHYAARLSDQNMARLRVIKPGEDWRCLPHELLPAGMQRALRKDHTRRFRRMTWSGIARSIITRFRDPKSGEYIHPNQHRTISIREAARIQSFPDWFVFEGSYSQQYEQVGNAVPPLLARAVATELHAMLKQSAVVRLPVKSRYRIPQQTQFALGD